MLGHNMLLSHQFRERIFRALKCCSSQQCHFLYSYVVHLGSRDMMWSILFLSIVDVISALCGLAI